MKTNTHIKYGIITTVVFIATLEILFITGLERGRSRIVLFPHVILLAGILLNAFAFSKANKARVSFTEVFKSCFKVSYMAGIAAVICYAIYFLMYSDTLHASSSFSDIAKSSDRIPKEDIPQLKYALSLSMGLAYLLTGCLYSIIAAAIVKKSKAGDSNAAVI